MKKIGFEECANLVKNQKIDGKTIAEADEEFLEDSLGIYDPINHHKLRYEVNQVRETKYTNINLYGYGSN